MRCLSCALANRPRPSGSAETKSRSNQQHKHQAGRANIPECGCQPTPPAPAGRCRHRPGGSGRRSRVWRSRAARLFICAQGRHPRIEDGCGRIGTVAPLAILFLQRVFHQTTTEAQGRSSGALSRVRPSADMASASNGCFSLKGEDRTFGAPARGRRLSRTLEEPSCLIDRVILVRGAMAPSSRSCSWPSPSWRFLLGSAGQRTPSVRSTTRKAPWSSPLKCRLQAVPFGPDQTITEPTPQATRWHLRANAGLSLVKAEQLVSAA